MDRLNLCQPLILRFKADYNMLGQRVATLLDRHHDEGRIEVAFNAHSLPYDDI